MLTLFNWGPKSVQHFKFCNFFQNQKSYKESKKKISRDKFICAHCTYRNIQLQIVQFMNSCSFYYAYISTMYSTSIHTYLAIRSSRQHYTIIPPLPSYPFFQSQFKRRRSNWNIARFFEEQVRDFSDKLCKYLDKNFQITTNFTKFPKQLSRNCMIYL